jgi:hypothetical protein
MPPRKAMRRVMVATERSLESRVLRLEETIYGDGEGLLARLGRLEEWAAEIRGILATLRWLIPLLTTIVAPMLAAVVSVLLTAALR